MAFLKNIWKTNSKHHKLSEELALQNSKELLQEEDVELNNDRNNDDIVKINDENDVITFKLKYLGSTIVEKKNYKNNNQISAESVKTIIKVAKVSRKKLQRVQIQISLKGIFVTDLEGNDLFKVSIYRISNCSTDPTHRQVFSFLSTDPDDDNDDKKDVGDKNETIMECHAFLCSKRKTAETVTLTVAQAFNAAYKQWRIRPKQQQRQRKTTHDLKQQQQQQIVNIEEEKLIDFDDNVVENDDDVDDTTNALVMKDGFLSQKQQQTPKFNDCFNTSTQWVCFDDDFIVNNSFKNGTVFA